MADLSFSVVDARPERAAMAPTLLLRLAIAGGPTDEIDSILLRCQIQIAPRQRSHSLAEQQRLFDLFGESERWRDTLKPLLWTQTTLIVPAFRGRTEVDLPLTCTYDHEVTAGRYLRSLEGGIVPLQCFFSGTVLSRAESGLRISQISWSKEARFAMPVQVWRDLMESYFPASCWVRLRQDTVDTLEEYKSARRIQGWDEAISALLEAAAEKAAR
jgi:hypothetical protein